ncbi:MAG: metallophosphoesterase family protein [Chloroflexi bacterium]|nr:metallophosphoesterase family protein [Chloroflexota bacterium]
MRLGIVADSHCNIAGLRRAVELMGPVDEILCAGDSIYEFRYSAETLRFIRETGMRMVLGNHEQIFISAAGQDARARSNIDSDTLDYLRSLPTVLETKLNGKRLLMAHGSPWDPIREYVYPHSTRMPQFSQLGVDIVVMGHTHCAMVKWVGRTLLINPGSCGESRNPFDRDELTCAVVDTQSDEAQILTFKDQTPRD